MQILAVTEESLKAFLQGSGSLMTDHFNNPFRPPMAVIDDWYQAQHAHINGRRMYTERPTPHPVGMQAGTDNLHDADLGWMEDTTRYQQVNEHLPTWRQECAYTDAFSREHPVEYVTLQQRATLI